MLRLRVRIERVDRAKSLETLAIANSGFVGSEPEVLLPFTLARQLRLEELVEPQLEEKLLGDGRRVSLMKYPRSVRVYIVTEDRVEGPETSSVLTVPGARYVLLNDKLLGRLRVVLLDFGEGLWCFRDEIGRKVRHSV